MLDDRDPASLSPEDVEAVLAALDRLALPVDPVDRTSFSFNLLMSALGSVIERVRLSDPDLVPTYIAAAQVMLDDA